jgi:hypothetical protein
MPRQNFTDKHKYTPTAHDAKTVEMITNVNQQQIMPKL